MDTPLKRCSKCGRDLPRTLEYFYRQARSKDGLAYICIDCNILRVQAWQQANAERHAATRQHYRATHKAEHATHQRQYYQRRKARKAGEK